METNEEVTLENELKDLTREFEISESNVTQDSTENQPDESSVPSDSTVETNNQNLTQPSEEKSVDDAKDDEVTDDEVKDQDNGTKDTDQENQTPTTKRKTARVRIQEVIAEKKLEQEKVREYQKKFEESQKEIAKLKQDKPKPHPNDPVPEYTPEQLEEYINSLEKDGDQETADQVKKLLFQKLKFENNRPMLDQKAKQKEYQAKFASEWNKNLEITKGQNPDLNNKESRLYKKTVDIFDNQETGKVLINLPNGAKLATDLAKLQIRVEDAIKTENELDEIKTKYQTLLDSTALNGDTDTFKSEESESIDPDKALKQLVSQFRQES